MHLARLSLVVVVVGFLACLAAAGADNDPPGGNKLRVRPPARRDSRAPARNIDPAIETAVHESARSFAEAYNRHDAKAIAGGFTASAEFVTEEGTVLAGREAIERHFQSVFSASPKASVGIRVEATRAIAPNAAIEEGTVESSAGPDDVPQYSRYVAVHVKQEGRWLVARARDFPAEPEGHVNFHHLRELEFLLGDWMGEGENVLTRTTCKWIDDRNYLLQEFTVQVSGRIAVSGTTRIGWDPQLRQIRSWTFDSQGGFSEAFWTHSGDEWVLKSRGTTHLGHNSSATTVLRKIDSSTLKWESRDRIDGAGLTANIKPILVKRRPPAPEE